MRTGLTIGIYNMQSLETAQVCLENAQARVAPAALSHQLRHRITWNCYRNFFRSKADLPTSISLAIAYRLLITKICLCLVTFQNQTKMPSQLSSKLTNVELVMKVTNRFDQIIAAEGYLRIRTPFIGDGIGGLPANQWFA